MHLSCTPSYGIWHPDVDAAQSGSYAGQGRLLFLWFLEFLNTITHFLFLLETPIVDSSLLMLSSRSKQVFV